MTKKELVTIKTVEAAYEKNQTKKLDRLIKEMKELDQGKIDKTRFEKARDAIECTLCEEQMGAETETGLCELCRVKEEKRKRAEKAEKEIEAKWWELHQELSKLDKNYKVKSTNSYGSNELAIEIHKGKDYCLIYRDTIYSGSGFHVRSRGNALRISTSDYNINAGRLMRDFGAKNLASHLHKKCEELLKKISSQRDFTERRKNEKQNLEQKILKAFPLAREIYQGYIKTGRNRSSESRSKSFKVGNVKFTTYNAENFTVSGIDKSMNLQQAKELVKMTDKFSS